MTTDEVFDIRMEKVDDHTSDSKYAIIGYFQKQQDIHNNAVARAAVEADPEAAMTVQAPRAAAKKSPTNQPVEVAQAGKRYTVSNILAESTAEQWLLAFIAFLLFINLICKN